MRTIDSFEDYVERTEEAINDIFLPVLFRQIEPLRQHKGVLVYQT